MDNPIIIDGSQGEGGGQMLRSALTMSAVTGKPFEMINIRANRSVPGLKRQHLTCVRAIATLCDATVTGDTINSQHLTFHPGAIKAGEYRFEIGTAGSVTLVAQTVLPALLFAKDASTVVIRGGTHVPMSPTWDFFVQTYLPQLRAMGADVTAKLRQYGFYPAGGGEIVLTIQPWQKAAPIKLFTRGEKIETWITAKVSHLSLGIAATEARIVYDQLPGRNMRLDVDSIAAHGPGNYCTLTVKDKNITAVFSEIGTYGKSRKAVANRVAQQAKTYLRAQYVADTYLSDQLLLPIVLAADLVPPKSPYWGCFTMPTKHSQHFDSNWAILKLFRRDCAMLERPHPHCKYTTKVYIGKEGIINEMGTI
jgi:RNA 3'-terminal phosphate cyclase (ATP)